MCRTNHHRPVRICSLAPVSILVLLSELFIIYIVRNSTTIPCLDIPSTLQGEVGRKVHGVSGWVCCPPRKTLECGFSWPPTLGLLFPQVMHTNPQSPGVSWHLSLRLKASAQAWARTECGRQGMQPETVWWKLLNPGCTLESSGSFVKNTMPGIWPRPIKSTF